MQNLETSQILAIAGSIIVFLGGLVLASIRATVATVKKDIDKLYTLNADLRHDFDVLYGEHCSTMHGRKQ